jgi:hypothetical protein
VASVILYINCSVEEYGSGKGPELCPGANQLTTTKASHALLKKPILFFQNIKVIGREEM